MNVHLRFRVAPLVVLGVLALLVSVPLAQTAQDAGTWKLNVAKSKYDPGPAPTSATTTVSAAGSGTRIVVDQVMSDGTKRHWEVTTQNDGKETPVAGNNPDADTVARTRVNATTWNVVYKKAGKVTLTQSSVLSADGKTRTVTSTGVNAKGQKVHNVAVYERQ